VAPVGSAVLARRVRDRQVFIGHAAAAIERCTSSNRPASEERFHHQALHDPLTNLPNRVLLYDRLSQAIAPARREPRPESVAPLVLDLTASKKSTIRSGITLAIGSAGGRLAPARTPRESDTVARLGATSLPPSYGRRRHVGARRRRQAQPRSTCRCFSRAASLDRRNIGVAAYPDHGTDVRTPCRVAPTWRCIPPSAPSPRRHVRARTRQPQLGQLALVGALRRRSPEELSLHHQPQIDCDTERLTRRGARALVAPERGLLRPDQLCRSPSSPA
jgi:hypothetical protein